METFKPYKGENVDKVKSCEEVCRKCYHIKTKRVQTWLEGTLRLSLCKHYR